MAASVSCGPSLEQALADFMASRRLANLSPRTVTWYEEQFHRVWNGAHSLPLSDVTLPLIRERLAVLSQQVKPTTVNCFIRALRALFNWLQEEEYTLAFDPRKLKSLKTEKHLPPVFTSDQLTALLSQPNGTWTGKRDHCLMALLLDTGIRVSEATGLKEDDVDTAAGVIVVLGKGRKQRTLALSLPMRRILRRWLATKRRVPSPWLFPTQTGEGLSRRTVEARLKRYGRQASIEGVRVSPHTFRSTFATHFCRQGGSIVHLQTILGHTTLEMSRRYAVAVDEDAFESSRMLSPLNAVHA
jgi:integrase/recombinase XerD